MMIYPGLLWLGILMLTGGTFCFFIDMKLLGSALIAPSGIVALVGVNLDHMRYMRRLNAPDS